MLHIKLNLNPIVAITSTFDTLTFRHVDGKLNFKEELSETRQIIFDWHNSTVRARFYSQYEDLEIYTLIATYEGSDILNIQGLNTGFILFSADVYAGMTTTFKNWVTSNIVELNQSGYTAIELYRLNDKRNVLNKTLTFIGIIEGQFKNPISVKSFSIDVIDYPTDSTYNYVYISKLKRYYYINDIAFVSANLTRLNLVEDVLMSWQTLIRSQSAFVTRQENSTKYLSLIDNRLPLEDEATSDFLTPTATVGGLVNTVFNTDLLSTDMNILIATKESGRSNVYSNTKINSPIAGLPSIRQHYSTQQFFYFMAPQDLDNFIYCLINDSATASFLDGIIWLPFNPSTPFNLQARTHNELYIGDKQFKAGYNPEFVSYTTVLQTNDQPYGTDQTTDYKLIMGCPYLIIFDGKFDLVQAWYNREPFTNYELWIPFVGYVKLESKDFMNKRILIYYSMDMRTGSATAYVYCVSQQAIIWSGGCQLGVKLDVTASNMLENTRIKQSADLNMILGLLSSATSIGVGIASENPVAVVGGVLSAGKTVAANVNTKMTTFNRASTNLGSNDAGVYQPLTVQLRATRHYTLSITTSVYKSMNGYPYNDYTSLSTLTGYTEIGDIQFNASNNDIYNVEIDEIVALLKSGVIM